MKGVHDRMMNTNDSKLLEKRERVRRLIDQADDDRIRNVCLVLRILQDSQALETFQEVVLKAFQ